MDNKKIDAEDKNTLLFELGYLWGVCRQLNDNEYAAASDSLEIIKNIIEKY